MQEGGMISDNNLMGAMANDRRVAALQPDVYSSRMQNGMTGAIAGASLKTYNNSKVRAGEKITNPAAHAKGYEKWVEDSIQKQIDKAK